MQYSLHCLEVVWHLAQDISQKATTVALVQGRTLGGGFEMALSCQYILAEEQSEFGLPEILFGLFPASGALPLLARRVHASLAEKMARTGKIFTAQEMLEMGIVDEVCPKGHGQACLERFLREHSKRRTARLALEQAKLRMLALSREELVQVVEDWVGAAKKLTAEELRVLETLVRMQRSEMAH